MENYIPQISEDNRADYILSLLNSGIIQPLAEQSSQRNILLLGNEDTNLASHLQKLSPYTFTVNPGYKNSINDVGAKYDLVILNDLGVLAYPLDHANPHDKVEFARVRLKLARSLLNTDNPNSTIVILASAARHDFIPLSKARLELEGFQRVDISRTPQYSDEQSHTAELIARAFSLSLTRKIDWISSPTNVVALRPVT